MVVCVRFAWLSLLAFYWVSKLRGGRKEADKNGIWGTQQAVVSDLWHKTARGHDTFCFAWAKLFDLSLDFAFVFSNTFIKKSWYQSKGHEWAHDLIIITVSFPICWISFYSNHVLYYHGLTLLPFFSFTFFLFKINISSLIFFKLQLDHHLTNIMQSYDS